MRTGTRRERLSLHRAQCADRLRSRHAGALCRRFRRTHLHGTQPGRERCDRGGDREEVERQCDRPGARASLAHECDGFRSRRLPLRCGSPHRQPARLRLLRGHDLAPGEWRRHLRTGRRDRDLELDPRPRRGTAHAGDRHGLHRHRPAERTRLLRGPLLHPAFANGRTQPAIRRARSTAACTETSPPGDAPRRRQLPAAGGARPTLRDPTGFSRPDASG